MKQDPSTAHHFYPRLHLSALAAQMVPLDEPGPSRSDRENPAIVFRHEIRREEDLEVTQVGERGLDPPFGPRATSYCPRPPTRPKARNQLDDSARTIVMERAKNGPLHLA